jgi:hypothetical protein
MKGKLIGIEATIDVREVTKKYEAGFILKYFHTCLHVIAAVVS